MNWFTDSSALVKRYVSEQGSKWLRHEIARHHVIIAQVTLVEVVAALRKRFRQGDISEFAYVIKLTSGSLPTLLSSSSGSLK